VSSFTSKSFSIASALTTVPVPPPRRRVRTRTHPRVAVPSFVAVSMIAVPEKIGTSPLLAMSGFLALIVQFLGEVGRGGGRG